MDLCALLAADMAEPLVRSVDIRHPILSSRAAAAIWAVEDRIHVARTYIGLLHTQPERMRRLPSLLADDAAGLIHRLALSLLHSHEEIGRSRACSLDMQLDGRRHPHP